MLAGWPVAYNFFMPGHDRGNRLSKVSLLSSHKQLANVSNHHHRGITSTQRVPNCMPVPFPAGHVLYVQFSTHYDIMAIAMLRHASPLSMRSTPSIRLAAFREPLLPTWVGGVDIRFVPHNVCHTLVRWPLKRSIFRMTRERRQEIIREVQLFFSWPDSTPPLLPPPCPRQHFLNSR